MKMSVTRPTVTPGMAFAMLEANGFSDVTVDQGCLVVIEPGMPNTIENVLAFTAPVALSDDYVETYAEEFLQMFVVHAGLGRWTLLQG